jgi:hypothetical protein
VDERDDGRSPFSAIRHAKALASVLVMKSSISPGSMEIS